MIKTDKKQITIPQWLCMIYDELVKLNNNIDNMNSTNADNTATSPEGKKTRAKKADRNENSANESL